MANGNCIYYYPSPIYQLNCAATSFWILLSSCSWTLPEFDCWSEIDYYKASVHIFHISYACYIAFYMFQTLSSSFHWKYRFSVYLQWIVKIYFGFNCKKKTFFFGFRYVWLVPNDLLSLWNLLQFLC